MQNAERHAQLAGLTANSLILLNIDPSRQEVLTKFDNHSLSDKQPDFGNSGQ